MWQEIIVAFVVLCSFILACRKMWRMLHSLRRNVNPCDNCTLAACCSKKKGQNIAIGGRYIACEEQKKASDQPESKKNG